MSTELSVPQQRTALADLRSHAMSCDIETMQAGLAEYAERRSTFRQWLLSQMVEGVHFGFPPGCRPSNVDPKQWRAKPSLYKAGAELVIDLMDLRQEYHPDLDGQKMIAGPQDVGVCVYKCKLSYRRTGEVAGEGIGAGKVGAKSADHNKAIKDCQKRGMVAAVLNTYGLSDLFTQDIEDGESKPEAEPPEPRDEAPKAQPRAERVTPQELSNTLGLIKDYLGSRGADNSDQSVREWLVKNDFVKSVDVASKLSSWDREKLDKLKAILGGAANAS